MVPKDSKASVFRVYFGQRGRQVKNGFDFSENKVAKENDQIG